MKKYVCSICGYIYDEAAGIPERGIAPGTVWKDIPEDWTCPLCSAPKEAFAEQKEAEGAKEQLSVETEEGSELKELSFAELSALCSNLSKGCEKQYLAEEAGLFAQLSEYYKSRAKTSQKETFTDLYELVRGDLEKGYPQAKEAAGRHGDRGALRALAWGEKVTRMLDSLLSRYEKEGDALIEKTNVYVCEICGFIYVGDSAPEICPVCKVPSMKLWQVQRR